VNTSDLLADRSKPGEFLLQVAHTAELDTSVLTNARELLDTVFEGDLTDDDWEHSIGGMHAVVWRGDALVGHASVVQRRLLHRDAVLRTGYVEGVGVHPDWQRHGLGSRMMEAIEHIIEGAYEIGALGASDDAVNLYQRRGWIRWLGPTSALTPAGIVRTPEEDGCVYVWPLRAAMDISADLTCDWREGDVW
jgi:aminoglycoside 2'-N-acetyltransferase I